MNIDENYRANNDDDDTSQLPAALRFVGQVIGGLFTLLGAFLQFSMDGQDEDTSEDDHGWDFNPLKETPEQYYARTGNNYFCGRIDSSDQDGPSY